MSLVHRFCRAAVLSAALISGTLAASGWAADYVLTIGGGYSPQGNQISLEKNVHYFQELLAQEKPGIQHDVYFSDGQSPGRDLQFNDPDQPVPEANRLMAEIFANTNYLGLAYRNSEIPGVRGESNRENLDRWFHEVGSTLQSGDRLLIYVTAHGGKSGDKQNAHNTKLYLWEREEITVAELEKHLDRLPEGVQVAVVMVQCYAGGFSNLIFNDARPGAGLSEQLRCGFFATTHERPAAGCTPDINEEDYHEYSSYFWAALHGSTRTGQAIERPDYDDDGQVSFEEAHAYVLLHSSTIDIPVKTSDAFLREYSTLKNEPELLTAHAAYDQLLALASPSERMVLEGLSTELELVGADRVQQAEALAKTLQEQRKELASSNRQKNRQLGQHKRAIQRDLKAEWPELSNLLNPAAVELLSTRAVQFVATIKSHSNYSDMARLQAEIAAQENARLDLERRWVKTQRFIRTAENVALAANLPKVAPEGIVARYHQLLSAERGTLSTR